MQGARAGIQGGTSKSGRAFIDTVRNPDEQSAIGCADVRFAPGGRTVRHKHPKGQALYVTDGIGLVARRGGRAIEIRPGDVVYIEPDEEHWHGATPSRFMAHVAVQEADDQGQVVTWLWSPFPMRIATPSSRVSCASRLAPNVFGAVRSGR